MNAILNNQILSCQEQLAELKAILESLPLATDEYGCAMNHLNNAHIYFQQGEFGAGKFEMRLLQATLKKR